MTLLEGKTIVIMGVANNRSIAWGCAQAVMAAGGRVILTYQNERMKKSLMKFVAPDQAMVACDVADDAAIDTAFATIKRSYGAVHGVIHAIAYADKESLANGVLNVSREGYNLTQEISAYSFIAVARSAVKAFPELESLVTLTYFGATHVIPHYDIMGVAKAALEANVRYLAKELGPEDIRVNAVSAGAIKTLAVTGVTGHNSLLKLSQEATVAGQSVTQREVGDAAAFLLSQMARGITGDILFVDRGVHLI